MRNKKGFASAIILVVAIVILLVAIILYGVFQQGGDNFVTNTFNYNQEEEMMNENDEEISTSDDVEIIEAELDSTELNSSDEDFSELEQDLQSL